MRRGGGSPCTEQANTAMPPRRMSLVGPATDTLGGTAEKRYDKKGVQILQLHSFTRFDDFKSFRITLHMGHMNVYCTVLMINTHTEFE